MIAGKMRSDLANELKNVKYISVMADSSTDAAAVEQENVLVRYLSQRDFKPVTKLVNMQNL